jgi:hypothetical protein
LQSNPFTLELTQGREAKNKSRVEEYGYLFVLQRQKTQSIDDLFSNVRYVKADEKLPLGNYTTFLHE